MTAITRNDTRRVFVAYSLALLVSLLISLGWFGFASADFTYTYTGKPFTAFFPPGKCTAGAGECMLSGFFKLARPLPVNLSSGGPVDCELTDFFFTDGVNSISLADLSKPCGGGLVVISTDAQGHITHWSLEAFGNGGKLGTSDIDNPGLDVEADSTSGFEQPGGGDLAVNEHDPGSWTSSDICTQQSIQTRPIELGVSGGNINDVVNGSCASGTLGSLIKNKTSKRYILSNNHVLAEENKAKRGQLIVQPGLVDTACKQTPGDAVAAYTRAVPLKFGSATNLVDAAIAEVTPGDVSSSILDIGGIASSVAPAAVLMNVWKMGRTTCFTAGTIDSVNADLMVNYASGIAKFKNQITIAPAGFSAAGDSGSLIVTQESCPRAVGLLFAGSQTLTFANPISAVLKQLTGGLSMVGSCTPAAASVTAQPDQVAGNLGISKEAVEAATAVRDRHEDELMSIPGAVGTGIGVGDEPGQPAIEVYVKKLTPQMQAVAPQQVEGVSVKLIESGVIVPY